MIKEEIEDKDAIEMLLTESAGRKVEIKTPQKGEKLKFVEKYDKKGNFEMIFIGVDFGDARVGLAKSDPAGILAGAVGTLKVRGLADAAEQTAEAVARLGGTAVVVGLPRNMDGTEGFRAERTRRFAALVAEKTGAEVVFVDERLSTVEAYTYMNITGLPGTKRKGKIDALSAQIILQSYLDAKKNG